MNKPFLITLLLSLLLFGGVHAAAQEGGTSAPTTPLTTPASEFYVWIPLIIISVFAAVSLNVIFYIIASLLNNSRLKATAISELGQSVGTVIVLVMILFIINLFGGTVYSTVAQLSGSSMTIICNQLSDLRLTHVDFLRSDLQGTPTNLICSDIIQNAGGSVTSNIDYGLGATYVILANVTNQVATSLNALYVFETEMTTLERYNSSQTICWPVTCTGNLGSYQVINFTYRPYGGYTIFRAGTLFVVGEGEIALFLGLLQLLIIILMLFGWPYILAAGLILRASSFTRGAGGLVIAMAVVGLFLYPILNVFEYTALTNTQASPIGVSNAPCPGGTQLSPGFGGYPGTGPLRNSQLGTNGNCGFSLPDLGLKGLPLGELLTPDNIINYDTHHINFYVFPRLDYILNYQGCWPFSGGPSGIGGVPSYQLPSGGTTGDSNFLLHNLFIAGSYAAPGYSLFLALSNFFGSFVSSLPSFIIGFGCTPSNVVRSVVSLSSFYGLVFVFSVLVPMLNILILLSGIKGIAALLGGDTNLLGLGRLLA